MIAPTKRNLQFTISTTMILIALSALGIYGFKLGFYKGLQRGKEQAVSVKSYYVGPFVKDGNYKSLIRRIEENCDPTSWSNGEFSISIFDATNSLIICQTDENHKLIESLISKLAQQVETSSF